jgi:NitT/TauT family transport system substrate-binding protein
MRRWRVLVAALVLAFAAGPAAAGEPIKLNLNFLPYGLHVGFFAAKEQGWYREAGMEVEILKGEGSADAVRRMGTGVVDFAFADLGSLILGRSRGLKVKALGVMGEKDPSVMISLKSAGIRNPKDLEGKSIGALTASALRDTWPPLAQHNNVDVKKVTWVDMPSSAYVASLMSRKVHAIATYAYTLPGYEVQARKIGEEVSALYYADFGVDTYGPGLLTSEQMIKEKPDLVRRFVQASMRGYAWSFEHPEEAVRLFLKSHPEASPERVRAEARVTADLMLTPYAAKEGIGHYDEKKVIQTRDLTLKPRNVDPATITVKDIYTNEFLPKLFPKRGNL